MNKVITYMETKYGEDFSLTGPFNGQFGKNYAMYELETADKQKGRILVRRMQADGKELLQDNYLAILLQTQIEDRIRVLAEEIFGICAVEYQVPELVFPAEFSADMTVEKFLQNKDSMIKVTVYVEKSSLERAEREAAVQRFLKNLRTRAYIVGGVLVFADGEYVIFSLNENVDVRYLEWRKMRGEQRKGKAAFGN